MHTGLAVITGVEDRQHAYVALTRGTDVNTAYVFTQSPKRAHPVPGPRPAPELARYDRLSASPGGQPAPVSTRGEVLAVLAGLLDRDGQQHSATQTRNQALAYADHLAILHAIWAAETTPGRDQHYKEVLMAALPPGHHAEPSHQAKWLWRTLRAAELASLDPTASWPTLSPNGTWPVPATSLPSLTPGSATGRAPWSRFRPARGPRGSPPSPIPDAARSSPRSPR